MKNQWPFWLFIIAILVVVIVALNYQGRQDPVPFGDIFSEEPAALEYEYITRSVPKVEEGAGTQSPAAGDVPAAGQSPLPLEKPVAPTVRQEPVVPSVSSPSGAVTAPAAGSYAVQILSSKDEKATETELRKVKASGFPEAYMRKADLGARGVWYRIYVGQYSTMPQAQEGLARVKQKYPQAFVFKF